MDKQLTLDELKEMHGKPVWCRIPSDNPRWGIVDAESSCVVLGANHRLIFCHYGEWKAFTSPDPTPSPTVKPGDKVRHKSGGAGYGIGTVHHIAKSGKRAFVKPWGAYYTLDKLEVIEND